MLIVYSLKRAFCLSVFLGIFLWFPQVNALTVAQVPGESLGPLLGKELANIRVYAADAQGQLRSIPFQVDEKTTRGKSSKRDWVWEGPPDRIEKQAKPNGKLDADEVLLFYPEQAGGGVDPSQWQFAQVVVELFLDAGGKRRVYLTWEQDPRPRSPEAGRVHYQPSNDQISTPAYQMAFQKKHPVIQDELIIKQSANPQDILDRFKVRFYLGIRRFFDFDFDEEEIKSRLLGYRGGPIRLHRRIEAWKSLGPVKMIPRSNIDFYFYPDWVLVETEINNPVDGPKALDEKTKGVSGFDFNKKIIGSKFYTNVTLNGRTLQGKPQADQEKINNPKLRWWALLGSTGNMLLEITNDSKLIRKAIFPELILRDAVQKPAPPEGEVGEIFIGFDLPYQKIPEGYYKVKVKQVYPKGFQRGQEQRFLAAAKIIRIKDSRVLKP